jgi:uncharacterized protein YjbI with pentapeptide repeats
VGTETAKKRVRAEAVIECIGKSRPVVLSHVEVVGGDLNFAVLPWTRIRAATRLELAGLPEPRANLELDELERELGCLVPGAIVIRQPVVITNATVHGAIRGPLPVKDRAAPYRPLVFLQRVDMSGTSLKGAVEMPYSRFRLPVLFANSTFEREIVLRSARFRDNVLFTHATFHHPVKFDEADFNLHAVFKGVEFKENAAAHFARAVFRRGVWFQGEGRPTRLRNADFFEAEFRGAEGIFEAVTFEGVSRFTKSHFADGARFVQAYFANVVQFDDAKFGGRVAFDRATFVEGADFPRATFEATVEASFDGATFLKSSVFDGARFTGPAHFVGTAINSGSFLDVQFDGQVDFRGARLSVAEFGNANARTTFGSRVAFDSATMGRATFENTAFNGPVSFSGATFGDTVQCSDEWPIALNFAAAIFAKEADFTSAVFKGHVNFSQVAPEPGQAKLRWHQIAGRFTSHPLNLVPEPKCADQKVFVVDKARIGPPRTDILQWLERNFRAREHLRDAREVFYERENEEAREGISSAEAGLLSRGAWLLYAGSYGLVAGYGVFPSHVLVAVVAVLLVFWMLILCVPKRGLSYQDGDPVVKIKAAELPIRSVSAQTSTGCKRVRVALCVSLAALLGVEVYGAHLQMASGDRVYWLLAMERAIGLILIVLLAHTLVNTMPGLEKLLGWLPGL